jgi:multiple sugar transport system permease protein
MASAVTKWTGLEHYLHALQDPKFWSSSWHTVRYVVLCVALHILLGLGLALLLNTGSLNRTVRLVSRSLLILPWTTTLVVSALMWRLLLNPKFSVFALASDFFGVQWGASLLTNVKFAYMGIVIANVWNFTPFYMLMILARLQAISPVLYEAADIDGASKLDKLIHITLPALAQIIVFLVVFDVIGTFVQFDLVWIMTNGGPLGKTEVLATHCYRMAFEKFDINFSAAIGILMMIGVFLWSAVIFFTGRKAD